MTTHEEFSQFLAEHAAPDHDIAECAEAMFRRAVAGCRQRAHAIGEAEVVNAPLPVLKELRGMLRDRMFATILMRTLSAAGGPLGNELLHATTIATQSVLGDLASMEDVLRAWELGVEPIGVIPDRSEATI